MQLNIFSRQHTYLECCWFICNCTVASQDAQKYKKPRKPCLLHHEFLKYMTKFFVIYNSKIDLIPRIHMILPCLDPAHFFLWIQINSTWIRSGIKNIGPIWIRIRIQIQDQDIDFEKFPEIQFLLTKYMVLGEIFCQLTLS